MERVTESESELAIRAQARDAKAFTALIRRHERTALAIAYATLGDASRAADVVQDAFVRAWEKLPGLKDVDCFGPWLGRMVRNLAIDERRKRPLRLVGDWIDDLDPVHDRSPSTALEQQETCSRVREALERLDEITRTAVVLRYYENQSSRQIAEVLDMTAAAVDMRLSRARVELKNILAPAEMDAPSAVQLNATI